MESLSSTESLEHRFETLYRIGVALSAERDHGRLIESILLEAKRLCRADGGSLYLVQDESLRFAMVHTDSLKVARGGTTGRAVELSPIPLFDAAGRPDRRSVATRAFHDRGLVHVPDAYEAPDFDQSGFRTFDARHDYRSVSLLAVPLRDSEGRVVAVLQLVNAEHDDPRGPQPFHAELQRTVEALAAQAGIALENQALLAEQQALLDAFIRILAEAIDQKSPYTGRHCERVPELTEMVTQALCDADDGPFASFSLAPEQWRELRVAAWLHDCGKVTTPVHVMDKATKLEAICDRIEVVAERYEVLRRDCEIESLRAMARGKATAEAEAEKQAKLATLDRELAFLRRINIGGEWLGEEDIAQLGEIATRHYTRNGDARPVLDPEWLEHLSVRRGTLTDAERLVVNGHMVQTIRMLEALPLPSTLAQVVEYAGSHHERMDGGGYPRGVFAGDLSIPARVMAIADVFEALTAADRPYKTGKPLSECARILAAMKENNHLDPEILDHCVRAGIFERYAARHLPAEQRDHFDAELILAVRPRPFSLPARDERDKRRTRLRPEYA